MKRLREVAAPGSEDWVKRHKGKIRPKSLLYALSWKNTKEHGKYHRRKGAKHGHFGEEAIPANSMGDGGGIASYDPILGTPMMRRKMLLQWLRKTYARRP